MGFGGGFLFVQRPVSLGFSGLLLHCLRCSQVNHDRSQHMFGMISQSIAIQLRAGCLNSSGKVFPGLQNRLEVLKNEIWQTHVGNPDAGLNKGRDEREGAQ